MSLTKVSYSMIQGAVFNALDYGADLTGATDSTSAIQEAIDAANAAYNATGFGDGGNTVYLPAGKYAYAGVILKPGVNLMGAGGWLTQLALTGVNTTGIKSPAATSGLAINSISTQISNLSLISGETTPSGQVMLNAIGFTYSTFTNVNFEWCGGCSGITMLNSVLAGSGGPPQWYNQFYSCNFIRRASRPAGGIAMQLGDTDGTKEQVTTWTFVGGRVSGAGDGSGLQLRGTGNQFFGVTFEGMDTAVYVGSNGTRGATANTFVGCYWEGNTVNRQIYANALNTMFTGSFVTGGTDTLLSDSVYFDEVGDYKAWLPSTGVWQITSQNAGAFRPQFISQTAFSGFDIVDSASNVATIYSVPQSSAGFNYLNAYANNLVDPIWEAGTAAFSPGDDNLKTLGRASFRWSTVYAATGTINTSDERTKQQVKPIDDAVLRAWGKVNYAQFKFNDAVEKKGDAARWHFGLVAQRVKEAFESEGLDAFQYGLLCYDKWEEEVFDHPAIPATPAKYDSDGNLVSPAKEGKDAWTQVRVMAGDRYGIRYEEALALECAYLRSKLA
jgi:hypothetical protein